MLCLLVRIGDESAPTPVLKRDVFKPGRSGRLFVQANDLDLADDGNGLQLTITGGLHTGDADLPPALLPVQAADRDWKPFLARVEAPGATPEQVHDAVFDYCLKYAGTPQSFRRPAAAEGAAGQQHWHEAGPDPAGQVPDGFAGQRDEPKRE